MYADAVMRFTLLALVLAAVMAPMGLVMFSRRGLAALCDMVPEPAVVIGLTAALLAVWAKIYADGDRLGWWDALARMLIS